MTSMALPDALPLAFMLLLTRSAGFFMALPPLLGVSVPAPVLALLSAVLAASLINNATVVLPAASGGLLVAGVILMREAAVGFAVALATAVMIAAVGLAGEVVGAQMELSASEILNAPIETAVVGEFFIAMAGFLFFGAGLQRVLFLGLGQSLRVAPLGAMALPSLAQILKGTEGMLVLGTSIAMPLMVPLLMVSLAQGLISRMSPQISLLIGAPAAVAMAGLGLMLLEASGIAWSVERAWTRTLFTMLAWLNG
jgi:flagellar biosynthetic protein FliR